MRCAGGDLCGDKSGRVIHLLTGEICGGCEVVAGVGAGIAGGEGDGTACGTFTGSEAVGGVVCAGDADVDGIGVGPGGDGEHSEGRNGAGGSGGGAGDEAGLELHLVSGGLACGVGGRSSGINGKEGDGRAAGAVGAAAGEEGRAEKESDGEGRVFHGQECSRRRLYLACAVAVEEGTGECVATR